MSYRPGEVGPRPFEVAAWNVIETGLEGGAAAHAETVFALANGTLGVRGTLEEGGTRPGAFLAGVYELHDIAYGERAYGFPDVGEHAVTVADPARFEILVDGERIDSNAGDLLSHRRDLDLRAGIVTRVTRWKLVGGVVLRLQSRRLVSLADDAIAAFSLTLAVESGRAHIAVRSALDSRSTLPGQEPDDPRRGRAMTRPMWHTLRRNIDPPSAVLVEEARRSGIRVAAAMTHETEDCDVAADEADGYVCLAFSRDLASGEALRLDKTAAILSSTEESPASLAASALRRAEAAATQGFEALARAHRGILDSFWRDADIGIDGEDALAQGLRFNLFQLLQSAPRGERGNIPAKGLTGDGYDGHVFWDSEIYMLPVFSHLLPRTARAMLVWRIRQLDAARARARELGHPRAALYPWRTIAGRECSAYFPAGTAQYHINADIAHAVGRYVDASGDGSLLENGGHEMVLETARLWPDLGHFTRPDHFEIHTVTGPDEYTALVDNNFYTNLMAAAHLRLAARLARERGGASEEEIAHWEKIAQAMYLPRAEDGELPAQDDSFLDKPAWDFASARYPLLLHYHPLVLYRHRVIKQADVLLAAFLRPEDFSAAEIACAFDYYEPLTTHDSSLSPCVHGIIAARLGRLDQALDFFSQTARIDLDDRCGNSADGIHAAAMAGSWLGLVAGFGGFRMEEGIPAFSPLLPPEWHGYHFTLAVRGSLIAVEVSQAGVRYVLRGGPPLIISHHGESLWLADETVR